MLGRSSVDLGVWPEPADRDRLATRPGTARRQPGDALRGKDGRTITRLMSARLITVPGGEKLILSITRDVTAWKQAEQERRDRGTNPPGPEAREHRAAGRRRGPRLQQPPHGHPELHRGPADGPGGREIGLPDDVERSRRRRARPRPHPAAAGLRAQAGDLPGAPGPGGGGSEQRAAAPTRPARGRRPGRGGGGRALAGVVRSRPDRAGAAQPGRERPGCHAQRRHARHRGPQPPGGGGGRRAGPARGRVGAARRPRRRRGHARGRPGAPLRAVLHHQGAGEGDRPGPGHGPRDRDAERRAHPRRERARRGDALRDLPPAHRLRRRFPRARAARVEARNRDRPARRGRRPGPRGHRPRAAGGRLPHPGRGRWEHGPADRGPAIDGHRPAHHRPGHARPRRPGGGGGGAAARSRAPRPVRLRLRRRRPGGPGRDRPAAVPGQALHGLGLAGAGPRGPRRRPPAPGPAERSAAAEDERLRGPTLRWMPADRRAPAPSGAHAGMRPDGCRYCLRPLGRGITLGRDHP